MRRTLVATTALVAFCAPALADPQMGGTANVAIRSDILGTEPGVRRDAITDNVLHHIMESLVSYGEDIAVQPMLAKSWEISEDGTQWTFALREGVTFHNGAPMTADEVVWSWNHWLDPATEFACLDWYDGSEGFEITAVEAVDDLTVRFTANRPNPLFLSQIANFQCLPAIVHPDSAPGDEWDTPIGTGPFVVDAWNEGESIKLSRFDGYAALESEVSGYAGNKTTYLDGVVFQIVPETSTALAGLQTGDLDLVYQLEPTDRAELEGASEVAIHEGPSLEWNVLLLQTEDPVLTLPMRRAIAHAIDFPALAQAVSSGISEYNPSTIPVSSTYHDDAQKIGYDRDLAMVTELLEEAGYDGTPIVIQTNRRYNNMYRNAVLAQAMLQEAGINAELEVLEWPAHLDNYFNGKFQLSAFGYSARTEPVLNYQAMLGSKVSSAAYQWDTEDGQALLEQAAATTDPAELQSLLDRIHEAMIEEVPTLNLYNAFSIDATSERLKGYAVWPAGKPRLWGTWIEE